MYDYGTKITNMYMYSQTFPELIEIILKHTKKIIKLEK